LAMVRVPMNPRAMLYIERRPLVLGIFPLPSRYNFFHKDIEKKIHLSIFFLTRKKFFYII
ncbi:MAG: hypothetical protein LUE20_00155, partial [Oscillospiraceae bacterium]|nr:hypothetical protein [Oscillospiraceae bacterium]